MTRTKYLTIYDPMSSDALERFCTFLFYIWLDMLRATNIACYPLRQPHQFGVLVYYDLHA